MKFPSSARFAKQTMGVVLLIGGTALVMFVFVTVMNADLYGRLIETQIARGVGTPDASSIEVPTARLVLHKLPADENAVEASLLLFIDGGALVDQVREGKARLTAVVHDGSSFQPYGVRHHVILDSSTANAEPGDNAMAVQSERFLLPALPSLGGFPFDNLDIRPIVDVSINDGYTRYFRLEIQKALPGRLMQLSDDNITTIQLTRSPTEKAIVVTSSLVFLFLSGILVYGLFAAPRGLTTLEELVAVGGYLIAAAGFRELLGISRTAGTSALEITVIGVPLLLLALGVAVSFIRGRLHAHRDEHDQISTSAHDE